MTRGDRIFRALLWALLLLSLVLDDAERRATDPAASRATWGNR